MIKKALIYLTLLIPVAAIAQKDPPVLKEFYKNAAATPDSFLLNDHVSILTISKGKGEFDILAVDDHMQTLWKTPLNGFSVSIREFKDKILVVTNNYSNPASKDSYACIAFILDPQTGKVLLEKRLFEIPADYSVVQQILTGNGKYLKIVQRETGFKRTMHVATIFSDPGKGIYETRNISVMDFDDQLNLVKQYKLEVLDETFISSKCDNDGNLFVSWFNQDHIDIIKYGTGGNTPVAKIKANMLFKTYKSFTPARSIKIVLPDSNSNIIYCAAFFSNADNKKELSIGKFDFLSGKSQFTEEVFTNDHVKSLRKAYIPVNKKLNDPDFNNNKTLDIRLFSSIGDKLLVSLSDQSSDPGMNGLSWMNESALLLNIYDSNINLTAHQFLPVEYSVPENTLPTEYYYNDNKLYVISNDKTGATKLKALYGVLNLNNGQWEKLNWLSKSDLDGSDVALSTSTLWFKNSFVLPYSDLKALRGSKTTIKLQQNAL